MRAATLKEQRERGRRSVAVLPILYPKELLTAFEVHAVELWGPPGAPVGPEAARIQTYVCPLVRNALAFLASQRADVDAVLFPHTCDSIQGLATLAPDFGGCPKKVFRFTHPKGASRPSARRFVEEELRSLAKELAEWTGRPLDARKIREAVQLHRAVDEARATLLARRACSPLSDRELYDLLRRGEYLWPEDHLAELRAAVSGLARQPVQRGIPLMISGYVPEPMSLFDALEDAGAYVAADDYAAVGRRVLTSPIDLASDPFLALADAYFAYPPCPTRGADQAARMRWLLSVFERSGAKGLLVHELKFCEPELFDVPALRKAFGARSIPVLYVEGELEAELSGQTSTRLEAFVELLSGRARA
ncbi:MAG TPA: 2-hydroxyacyl-CoA dehydratase family protein [Myxococcales bacterium]|jgi:benzoyl-CoA reductase/2-hydroxyglutaryl-CoA dehydratase subunit BcrC/BadD/HgdB